MMAVPLYLSDRDIVRAPASATGPVMTVEAGSSSEAHLTALAERGQMVAEWVRSYLEPLRSLAPDWDSYGGLSIHEEAIEAAEAVATALLVEELPWPVFMPRPDGGVALEWDRPMTELVIEFPGTAEPLRDAMAYFSDQETGEAWQDDLDSAVSRIRDALTRFPA